MKTKEMIIDKKDIDAQVKQHCITMIGNLLINLDKISFYTHTEICKYIQNVLDTNIVKYKCEDYTRTYPKCMNNLEQ